MLLIRVTLSNRHSRLTARRLPASWVFQRLLATGVWCGVVKLSGVFCLHALAQDISLHTGFVCGVPAQGQHMDPQILEALGGRAGMDGGAGQVLNPPYTEGIKRLLVIRVDFADLPGEPFSEAAGLALMSGVRDFFLAASYHRARFLPAGLGSDLTPTLRMPQSAAYYGNNNLFNQLRADARLAAEVAGYARDVYEFDVTAMGLVPGFAWTGLGNVGMPGAWMRNNASPATLAHELGHNFGLNHANFWDTAGKSVIGAGTSVEYGDIFDTMGSGGLSRVFNARYKHYLNWLKADEVMQVTSNGTYRLYAHDATNGTRLVRGLYVPKNNGTNYWLEFRQTLIGQSWVSHGAQVRWALGANQSSLLLDTSPGSGPGQDDAPILVGQTFSDDALGLHVTVTSRTTAETDFLEVVVNRGAFLSNAPPGLTVAASTAQASIGMSVVFTATASDPNGDELAYFWDFGDGTFGDNSPVANHDWPAAGDYLVRCVVTDMKGGRASASLLVVVGAPDTYRISGRVLSEKQVPVEGVRVVAPTARTAYSDSNGGYVLTGLGAGVYGVEAGLEGYEISHPAFTNPVRVGPNAQNIDFVAQRHPEGYLVNLIPPGSQWRYRDDGSNQGTAWRGRGFEDGLWNVGLAQLGYGDGDEVTEVHFGGDTNNRFITTYFRHTIFVEDPLQYAWLKLGLLRDDGALVYINGEEVMRSNMPEGAVDYLTLAPVSIGTIEERTFLETTLLATVLAPGTNVIAVEVHQEDRDSGDLSFDLSLQALRIEDLPPGVYLESPTQGADFREPDGLLLSANARARDPATIIRVEFYEGANTLGQADALPYSMVWSNPPFGAFRLTARAWETTGRCMTSAPVDITVSAVLIARGSPWSFHDLGIDLGRHWALPQFNDASWMNGPAQLGYGDGDERTLIRFGTNPNNKNITTYFRRQLEIADATSVTQLTYRLLRDDGAVVYLNGTEQFRSNVPESGLIAYSTLASESAGGVEERTYYEARVPSTALVDGQNTVAVEVHQESASSSDLSFDLELFATGPGPPPPLRIAFTFDGQNFELSWPASASAAGWHLYTATRLDPGTAWDQATEPERIIGERTVVVVERVDVLRFYRLQCEACAP